MIRQPARRRSLPRTCRRVTSSQNRRTICRLFLEKSKDEYKSVLKELIPEKGISGPKGYRKDKETYIQKLNSLKLEETMHATMNREYTWKKRKSDFRKLVAYQNQGYIYRIYTKAMRQEFLEDLRLLKEEKNL